VHDLTLAAAVLAGLLSFLSPCVLPVVPAYLGQLGALAVMNVGQPTLAVAGGPPITAVAPASPTARRLQVLPHALAFVAGFGGVFTGLGLAGAYALGAVGAYLPDLRRVGGVMLIVLGLNLAGVLRLRTLARTWKPLERFGGPKRESALARSPAGAFGLGAVFALGWTPCIGPTLGAIFGLASRGPSAQAGALFVAYSLGLGIPFVALALTLDRAPQLIRPLLRHGRIVEIVGGGLVVIIGVAIATGWLDRISAQFRFLVPAV